MQDLTILEAARELGYSKNAVKYQVAKLPLDLVYKDEKQVTRLKPAAIKELRQIMGQKQPTNNHATTTQETEQQPANNQQTTTQTTTQENALYSALLQTVETLQQQLAAKDRQLEAAEREKAEILARLKDAQHAEQQAHALHAGTMQQAALIETRTAATVQEEAPTAQDKKRGWRFWHK